MFAGAPDVAPVPGPDRLLELASPAAAASAIVFPDDPAVRWRLRDDVVDSHVPAFLYHRLEREIDVLWSDDAVALLAAACAQLPTPRRRLSEREIVGAVAAIADAAASIAKATGNPALPELLASLDNAAGAPSQGPLTDWRATRGGPPSATPSRQPAQPSRPFDRPAPCAVRRPPGRVERIGPLDRFHAADGRPAALFGDPDLYETQVAIGQFEWQVRDLVAPLWDAGTLRRFASAILPAGSPRASGLARLAQTKVGQLAELQALAASARARLTRAVRPQDGHPPAADTSARQLLHAATAPPTVTPPRVTVAAA
jgi:hypothetical protein